MFDVMAEGGQHRDEFLERRQVREHLQHSARHFVTITHTCTCSALNGKGDEYCSHLRLADVAVHAVDVAQAMHCVVVGVRTAVAFLDHHCNKQLRSSSVRTTAARDNSICQEQTINQGQESQFAQDDAIRNDT